MSGPGQIKYYDTQRSVVRSSGLITYGHTVVKGVATTREFWVYVLFHIVMVSICKFVYDGEFEISWGLVGSSQYFMIFFVTFFNTLCFHRYAKEFYPLCNELMDSAVMIVHQMNTTLYHTGLRRHRILVTKYLVATVLHFFLLTFVGKLGKMHWKELIHRGLLTGREATMLARYPGNQACLVLSSWILFLLRDATESSHCHQPVKLGTKLFAMPGAKIYKEDAEEHIVKELIFGEEVICSGPPDATDRVVVEARSMDDGKVVVVKGIINLTDMNPMANQEGEHKGREGWRAQGGQSVHIYNRCWLHMQKMLRCCHTLGHTMAMPVPYCYYHLMNATLTLNLIVIAVIPAFYRSWFTVPVFMVALTVIHGIKVIAAALADPFADGDYSFPFLDFIRHAYDRIVSLLMAEMSPEVRRLVMRRIPKVTDFTPKHLARHLDAEVIYPDSGLDPMKLPPLQNMWHRNISVFTMSEEFTVEEQLAGSLTRIAGEYTHDQKEGVADEDLTELERRERAENKTLHDAKEAWENAKAHKYKLRLEAVSKKKQLEDLRECLVPGAGASGADGQFVRQSTP